ncbi:MAG: amino acid adenylation domain-containing protein [Gemmatimonadaceae bacterium]|nr:amino acid adenylation domain-containing protein [Gemmatimonadaceae bacterium]
MERTPEAIAVEFQQERVSYRDLNARANRLAHHLRTLGVRPGALVGLCLERTPDLLVALLAALKSGAGYVPLDPNYPVDRLAYMAGDAALAVLITDTRLAGELALPAAATVRIDADEAAIAACSAANPVTESDDADPETTAPYVIYTSGSTGRPKGVLVPHRSVVNLLASVRREPGLTGADTVLAITTLSFDIAVSEVILPLTVGARIVLASRETASDGAMLMELVESTGVTFIDATPATYRLLLASGWSGSPTLRVICTGEAMPLDLAQKLTSCAADVWNGYGPTETTVWSTFARVTPPVKRVLIGRPVANTVVHILDAAGQQVPIGVPGEMFIAGSGVTKGYLNRPDLTSERFAPDPAAPGRLIYRTGDLVRLLPNGELECLGRNDNQVKVRGFRIEPAEIEAVLMQYAGVHEAVVIAREDRVNDVRLVAYLVTENEDVVSSSELRAFAKASLPDYMVPYTFVRMDAMPLTPSGKVDRKALPAPQVGATVTTEGEHVAPATESEQLIAGLWQDVLGLPAVSVVDDFFALGGHSLLASQVLSRLRRDYGIQLSFRKIFEAPTVRALAALVDASRPAGAPLAAPAAPETIPHRPDATSAPLSVLQERLWMLEELEPTQLSAHAHSASWRLFGALDLERLDRAFAQVIARHATLRTSFHTIDGERRQVVAPTSSFVLERRDLSAMDAQAQDAALNDFFREQQFTTFDLSIAPLYRACVLKLSDEHHLLYSLQHGMVWDGWSFDLFLKEITELYAAEEAGRAPELNALPITYGDFAAWQPSWLEGPEAAAQREWWRTQLAGELQELDMPTDFLRPALSSNAGNQISLPFSVEEADQLRALARRYDATLFMVVFAAYNVILHHYTGQNDLLVGSPVRARTRPELEVLIGPFINTVLLRTRVSSEMTFPDLLRAVRRA